MKKVLIICGLLFSVVTFAQAQQQGGGGNGANGGGNRRAAATPEERATRSTDQLDKTVTLTADQKPKVNAIYLEQATAMAKLREESKDDRTAMMAKMKPLNDATDAKIVALLTADQKKAFETAQAARAEAMKNRGAGGGAGGAGGAGGGGGRRGGAGGAGAPAGGGQ